jgi:hypothetical protein
MHRRTIPEPLPDHCLNCHTAIVGRYCHACGQENEPSRVAFGAFLADLWETFVAVDNKLLRTLGLLAIRPGFLTTEYLSGRRVRYISPFKLYFWTTAIFVLLFSQLFWFENEAINPIAVADTIPTTTTVNGKRVQTTLGSLPTAAKPAGATASAVNLDDEEPAKVQSFLTDLSRGMKLDFDRDVVILNRRIRTKDLPETVTAYREAQKKLPENERDDRTLQFLKTKLIHYRANPEDTVRGMVYNAIPNVLIFCVPLFAVLIKCFFPRRLYIEHLTFALHTHTLAVILLAAWLGITRLAGSAVPGLSTVALLALLAYNFLAARRVYAQAPGVLLAKGGCLTAGYGCIFGLAIVLGFLLTLVLTFINL